MIGEFWHAGDHSVGSCGRVCAGVAKDPVEEIGGCWSTEGNGGHHAATREGTNHSSSFTGLVETFVLGIGWKGEGAAGSGGGVLVELEIP